MYAHAMALAFQPDDDVLPPGAHSASAAEVEETLVDGFAESHTRRPIYVDWLALRDAIREIAPFSRQWLDGSFVTKKLDPNDLDLASFFDSEVIEALDATQESCLNALVSGPSEAAPRCDSYPIIEYPDGHPLHDVARSLIDGFDQIFFGTGPSGPGSKGYVEVSE